ncbi:hypothetical protein K3G63_22425 [Hymenobacter sp. HSC-4F20]|uniref:hypothetical protein n=1 Tax=Hymenobacter sp. HSC-4F20 TaxID=2864135 RepID=UPI001C734FC7|nr:hypothetical protein [Hymenobacter sp. HSC-4F20]MBX0293218.1 hypothetical protein [Hymenobacter sp. HSC-4F20]
MSVLRKAQAVKAIVGSNRLEPRPRSTEFNRSLRAEIRDPAWLLARQWQMKEFRAEDRGTPAYAQVQMELSRLNQLAGPEQPPRAYLGAKPLEAVVQAQPVLPEPGLRLQMGQHWLRLLRTQSLSRYAPGFRTAFKLSATPATAGAAYAQERTTAEVHQLLLATDGQALDGYELYQALLAGYPTRPAAADAEERVPVGTTLYQYLRARQGGPAVDAADVAQLDALSVQFVNCYFRLYFASEAADAWSVPDMSYQFTLGAPTSGAAPQALGARAHAGAELPWYTVDQQAATGFSNAGTGSAVAPLIDRAIEKKDWPDQYRDRHPDLETQTLRFLPTEIQFPGAPNARWWEFEDRKVDFGQLTGDPSDFGRMLLQEFMFLYQNDWFVLPYEVPVGSLCAVKSLQVTDVFGTTYQLEAAGANQQPDPDGELTLDHDAGRWSLFGHAQPGQRTSAEPRLLVPPTAVAPLVSKPVEQVRFRREEATNLVWALEDTIPNGFSRGMDGNGAAALVAEYFRTQAEPATTPAGAKYAYRLASSVAENWIPFVPTPDGEGTYHLEQGQMRRGQPGLAPDDQVVQPRTSLLQLGGPTAPYRVHEYQVPPTGMRVESAFHRTRWLDGRTVLWFGRHRAVGQGSSSGGSSGLVFDQLLTATPASAGE